MTRDSINTCNAIVENVATVFVGDRELMKKLLAGALANGHLLFEDDPGLGKTLLVKVFARTIGSRSDRIQFTPDLLPADILGTKVWNSRDSRFDLVKGPIFTNILLADEINRAPPKTQSALLEAMEERQVTIDGESIILPRPFFVLATQNPIEQEGTYALPEAQLDRFMMKLSTGYPLTHESEVSILERRLSWRKDDPSMDVRAVVDADEFRGMQQEVERDIYIHKSILDYIAEVVRAVRDHPSVAVGPSPRGALALMKAGRALAYVNGRDFVTPDDVKGIFEDALAHRLVLELDDILDGADARELVRKVVETVDAPKRYGRESAPSPLVR